MSVPTSAWLKLSSCLRSEASVFWPITVLGALAGLLLASIPGALLGGLLGQVLDRRLRLRSWADLRQRMRKPGPDEQALLFILLGRLAKSGGAVRPTHIQQAREEMRRLQLDGAAQQRAVAAFNRGKTDADNVRRPLQRLRGQNVTAEGLLCACWRLAWAEGQVSASTRELILRWGQWLGWSRDAVLALQTPYVCRPNAVASSVDAELDALRVLGVSRDATPAQIKQAYRRLLSRHHPDKLAGAGASAARLREATEITSELHRAYALLRQRRSVR